MWIRMLNIFRNFTQRKILSTEAKPRLTVAFEGWRVSIFSQHLSYYTKCYRNNRQHNVWFQNNQGQLSNCSCSSLFYIFKASIVAGQNLWWTVRAFILRSRYFFMNIIHRQTISPVAKVHHVLGRCLMNKQVILLLMNCFLANHNQFVSWKYNIADYRR